MIVGLRTVSVVVLAAGLLGCGADSGVPPTRGESPARPHILLVSIDTLRADHLGAWGYERETSPFLDQLAAEGRRFSHAFVNTHGTPPSHTTLFSSLAQESHRVGMVTESDPEASSVVPPELDLLPEILARSGYATLAVTGGGFLSEEFGLSQGFSRFATRKGIRRQRRLLVHEIQRARATGQPVFAFLHSYEVHSPYKTPKEYGQLFGTFESDFRPTSRNLRALRGDVRRRLAPDDLAAIVAAYDRGIRYFDDELKRLFDELSEIGFLDDAIVLITSDHGEEFGEHGRVLHPGSLFDELLHVPLILSGPGVTPGTDDRMVSTLDLAPTLLGVAGEPVPAFMRGRNLLDPAIPAAEFRAVFSQYGGLLYSVRTRRYKLIQSVGKGRRLYDLVADPEEQVDIAAANKSEVRRLARALAEWRRTQPDVGASSQPTPELDAEQTERLRSLGYL